MINIFVYGKYNIIESYYKYKIIKDGKIIKIDKHLYNIKNTIGRKPTIVARGIYNAILFCIDHKLLDEKINIICNDIDIVYVIQNQDKYTSFSIFNKLFKALYKLNYNIKFENLSDNTNIKNAAQIYVKGSYNKNIKCYTWAFSIYSGNKLIKNASGKDNIANSIWKIAGKLSATMRALEYCAKNNIKDVCINYDYNGIYTLAVNKRTPEDRWTRAYQEFMLEYMGFMNINFKKLNTKHNNFLTFRKSCAIIAEKVEKK